MTNSSLPHLSETKGVGVFKTEGIILKTVPFGELDLLLTIYSKEYGKIQARAISARKRESKLKGYLQPFCHAKFMLAKSKTIDIVTEVQAIDNFLLLHSSLKSLAYAFYFAEIIDRTVFGQEKDERLWSLILRAFEVLDQKKTDLPKVRQLFEKKFIEFLGYGALESKNKTALEFIQELAGEEIRSKRFLEQIK
jgi:DNA repair protein RecO (recombination protein O)